jgi:hypothetical protein
MLQEDIIFAKQRYREQRLNKLCLTRCSTTAVCRWPFSAFSFHRIFWADGWGIFSIIMQVF